jgi:large subunit ribosomal protein L32
VIEASSVPITYPQSSISSHSLHLESIDYRSLPFLFRFSPSLVVVVAIFMATSRALTALPMFSRHASPSFATVQISWLPMLMLRNISNFIYPATAISIPAISLSIPGILTDIWEGLLRAVPKKKTSHMKRRHRQLAGKALKDVRSINSCPACGEPKRLHHLCPTCVEGTTLKYENGDQADLAARNTD